ncbi:MAG TPA: heavy metal translocating P-type ATPase [Solidesulfovibrio magneticus]|nr:heavy metal translocating P-type ATPase [Solidesulfovibrio magneticus]
MKSVTLLIKDMDCAEEVGILKKALLPLVEDESRLTFDVLARKLTVDLTGLPVSRDQIIATVAKTGMKAEPFVDVLPSCACCSGVCPPKDSFWSRHGRLLLCAASGAFWVLGFAVVAFERGSLLAVFKEGHVFPPAVTVLWLTAALMGVWHVLPKAVHSLRSLSLDMNLLMAVAVTGAMAIGEYSEGASVAFLFALANQLESWSVGRARRAIQALMRIAPPTALVLAEGSPHPSERRVEEVPVGSLVLVRPGDRVPLDGLVHKGSSSVDQSPITGESMPVPKGAGDFVYAGTFNADGALEVETTKLSSDTTLARIMHMVEAAQSRRAKAVQWVEKFALVYTPVMVSLALLVAVVPPLFLGGNWTEWFYQALVVLVISCPCALVISTPVSIVAGLASAARNGVLIKGGVFLETPASITAIALDKTGTLTHGRPAVSRVMAYPGTTEGELLAIAAALESRSSHPLAQAILRHARSLGIDPPAVEESKVLPGRGAAGRIQNTHYFVGNERMLREDAAQLLSPEVDTILDSQFHQAGTMAFVWDNSRLLGMLALEDKVRPESRNAIEALKRLGIRRIIMLTGDNERTARDIAEQTGVTEFQAELLPEAKTRFVSEMVEAGERVAMVGDGVNDAPALAVANLGVAMGAIGTDVAIETSDMALMSDDLSKLPWLIRHSRRVLSTIRQNIVFALGLKIVFLVLAFLQLATLWTAILADMGASLIVIFNGLRLLRIRK